MAVLGAECILSGILAFSILCTSAQHIMSLNFCSIKPLWENVRANSMAYQKILNVSYKIKNNLLLKFKQQSLAFLRYCNFPLN